MPGMGGPINPAYTRLKVEDALSYLDQVKLQFQVCERVSDTCAHAWSCSLQPDSLCVQGLLLCTWSPDVLPPRT